MNAEKALAIAALAVVTVILAVLGNASGAWLVTYGGTLGMALMPIAITLIIYIIWKMWQISLRKLFPTTKAEK